MNFFKKAFDELQSTNHDKRMKKWNLGIDVGGTNIAMGAVKDGEIIEKWNKPIGDSRGPNDVFAIIKQGLADLVSKLDSNPQYIGAGIPGIVDFEAQTALRLPHFSTWNHVEIGKELSNILGMKVVIDNDANFAAFAEMKFGSGKGLTHFILLTLGTGIGCGLVLNNQIFRGEVGFAGEVGHIVVDPGGPPCTCTGRGCWEGYASGGGMPDLVKMLSMEDQAGLEKVLSGESITAKIASELASEGNRAAISLWLEFGKWFGIGIATLTNTLGVTKFIIGGNVSKALDLFSKNALKTARNHTFDEVADRLDLIPAKLGADAGMIGAATPII